jgi:serine/threonine protein kinase
MDEGSTAGSGDPRSVVAIGPGALLKGRYRIERLLGRGGMASVWRADDTVLDRAVAVKVLSDTIASDPEFLTRFRREALVVAGIWHPNLIAVYDFADGAERPYLVLEYVAGGNLAERLSTGVPIDSRRLARELLGAVAHIHGAEIVHRDIKPHNILLGPEGSAKLIDFGIALPPDATALTRTGHLIGTARYLAPEVMNGEPATERSDLYACGMVLREALGENPPAELRASVDWLCAADPRARAPSASAVLARIQRSGTVPDQPTEQFAALGERRQSRPQTPVRRRSSPKRRGRRTALARIAAVAAILVAVGVAAIVIAGGSGDKEGGEGVARAGEAVNNNSAVASGTQARSDSREEPSAAEGSAAAVPVPAGDDAGLGGALNEEGFGLIQAGQYEEAVPVLEEAVRAFPPGSEDINYAYALYNLGNALRLSGRPADAIPVLEQRLAIPNQTGTVSEELEAARSEAGQ